MPVTDDPNDPRLSRGVTPKGETEPQSGAYLVLSDEERARGFIRPVRCSYVHDTCGAVTTMGPKIAATYARDPKFYGSTYCCTCAGHFRVAEFRWDGSPDRVGS